MFMVIVLTAIAAIAVLVGLFVASNQLYIDALFMQEMREQPPVFSEEVRMRNAVGVVGVDRFSRSSLFICQIYFKPLRN